MKETTNTTFELFDEIIGERISVETGVSPLFEVHYIVYS